MKPHKHVRVIKYWAEGYEIECFDEFEAAWFHCKDPEWHEHLKYRVKPIIHKFPVKLSAMGNRLSVLTDVTDSCFASNFMVEYDEFSGEIIGIEKIDDSHETGQEDL